ncbi:hypothetical protein ACYSTU_17280, partial [Pseudomonas glycinis]
KLPLPRYRNECWQSLGGSSNLSFIAIFYKRKPLIFLEKVGGLWFFASQKWPYGTEMGLAHCSGAEKGGL